MCVREREGEGGKERGGKMENTSIILLKRISPYKRTKYRMHRMSRDRKYIFSGSLQPTDA